MTTVVQDKGNKRQRSPDACSSAVVVTSPRKRPQAPKTPAVSVGDHAHASSSRSWEQLQHLPVILQAGSGPARTLEAAAPGTAGVIGSCRHCWNSPSYCEAAAAAETLELIKHPWQQGEYSPLTSRKSFLGTASTATVPPRQPAAAAAAAAGARLPHPQAAAAASARGADVLMPQGHFQQRAVGAVSGAAAAIPSQILQMKPQYQEQQQQRRLAADKDNPYMIPSRAQQLQQPQLDGVCGQQPQQDGVRRQQPQQNGVRGQQKQQQDRVPPGGCMPMGVGFRVHMPGAGTGKVGPGSSPEAAAKPHGSSTAVFDVEAFQGMLGDMVATKQKVEKLLESIHTTITTAGGPQGGPARPITTFITNSGNAAGAASPSPPPPAGAAAEGQLPMQDPQLLLLKKAASRLLEERRQLTRLVACVMPTVAQLVYTQNDLSSRTREHEAESARLKRQLEEAEREKQELQEELRTVINQMETGGYLMSHMLVRLLRKR